jgi:hypothetical protein
MNTSVFVLSVGCAMIAGTLTAQVIESAEFAMLKAQYDQKVKFEVQQPHDVGVAELNVKYTGALDRALEAAQQTGKLDEALAIKDEKEAIATGNGIPAADDENTLPLLKQLRGTYRATVARLEIERSQRLQPLQIALGRSLDALVSSLTKQGKLKEALTVKQQRDAFAATAGTPAPTALGKPPVGGFTSNFTKESPFVNGLGMKFVPVPGTNVLFCIHETRYKDYAAYAAEASKVDGSWKDQSAEGFTPTEKKEEHPVTKVIWPEAQAFCAWLGKKESKTYRLPTDHEWSLAVGLSKAEKWTPDASPESLNGKVTDEFPWETAKWPPLKGAGNYSDQSRKTKATPVSGAEFFSYEDGYPTTAPVMSFKPNKLGLYDMGGNVWEWCEDWYNKAEKERVLRGGAWFDAQRDWEYSSRRLPHTPESRKASSGFRVALVTR